MPVSLLVQWENKRLNLTNHIIVLGVFTQNRQVFAKKGRAADNKSKDFEKLHEIAEKWRTLGRGFGAEHSRPVGREEETDRLSGALESGLSFNIYVLAFSVGPV